MKIAVYTVLLGNYDKVKPINPDFLRQADFYLFTDCIEEAPGYIVMKVNSKNKNLRRLTRDYKLRPHRHFLGYDYTIYLDASIEMLRSPRYLIDRYLNKTDIAALKHPWRDCVYDEMKECLRLGIADWDLAHEQARYYRKMKYPEHHGLTENGVILRKTNYEIKEFNDFWYFVYEAFTERDQFSFCYCAWRMGIEYTQIPNNIRDHKPGVVKEFNFIDHPR